MVQVKRKRNKNANTDFKRRKAKVGRKLERANLTDTTFSYSSVAVRPQKGLNSISEQQNSSNQLDAGWDNSSTVRDYHSLDHYLSLCDHHNIGARKEAVRTLVSFVRDKQDIVRANVLRLWTVALTSICDVEAPVRRYAFCLIANLAEVCSFDQVSPYGTIIMARLRAALTRLHPETRLDALATVPILCCYQPRLIARHAIELLSVLTQLIATEQETMVAKSLIVGLLPTELGLIVGNNNQTSKTSQSNHKINASNWFGETTDMTDLLTTIVGHNTISEVVSEAMSSPKLARGKLSAVDAGICVIWAIGQVLQTSQSLKMSNAIAELNKRPEKVPTVEVANAYYIQSKPSAIRFIRHESMDVANSFKHQSSDILSRILNIPTATVDSTGTSAHDSQSHTKQEQQPVSSKPEQYSMDTKEWNEERISSLYLEIIKGILDLWHANAATSHTNQTQTAAHFSRLRLLTQVISLIITLQPSLKINDAEELMPQSTDSGFTLSIEALKENGIPNVDLPHPNLILYNESSQPETSSATSQTSVTQSTKPLNRRQQRRAEWKRKQELRYHTTEAQENDFDESTPSALEFHDIPPPNKPSLAEKDVETNEHHNSSIMTHDTNLVSTYDAKIEILKKLQTVIFATFPIGASTSSASSDLNSSNNPNLDRIHRETIVSLNLSIAHLMSLLLPKPENTNQLMYTQSNTQVIDKAKTIPSDILDEFLDWDEEKATTHLMTDAQKALYHASKISKSAPTPVPLPSQPTAKLSEGGSNRWIHTTTAQNIQVGIGLGTHSLSVNHVKLTSGQRRRLDKARQAAYKRAEALCRWYYRRLNKRRKLFSKCFAWISKLLQFIHAQFHSLAETSRLTLDIVTHWKASIDPTESSSLTKMQHSGAKRTLQVPQSLLHIFETALQHEHPQYLSACIQSLGILYEHCPLRSRPKYQCLKLISNLLHSHIFQMLTSNQTIQFSIIPQHTAQKWLQHLPKLIWKASPTDVSTVTYGLELLRRQFDLYLDDHGKVNLDETTIRSMQQSLIPMLYARKQITKQSNSGDKTHQHVFGPFLQWKAEIQKLFLDVLLYRSRQCMSCWAYDETLNTMQQFTVSDKNPFWSSGWLRAFRMILMQPSLSIFQRQQIIDATMNLICPDDYNVDTLQQKHSMIHKATYIATLLWNLDGQFVPLENQTQNRTHTLKCNTSTEELKELVSYMMTNSSKTKETMSNTETTNVETNHPFTVNYIPFSIGLHCTETKDTSISNSTGIDQSKVSDELLSILWPHMMQLDMSLRIEIVRFGLAIWPSSLMQHGSKPEKNISSRQPQIILDTIHKMSVVSFFLMLDVCATSDNCSRHRLLLQQSTHLLSHTTNLLQNSHQSKYTPKEQLNLGLMDSFQQTLPCIIPLLASEWPKLAEHLSDQTIIDNAWINPVTSLQNIRIIPHVIESCSMFKMSKKSKSENKITTSMLQRVLSSTLALPFVVVCSSYIYTKLTQNNSLTQSNVSTSDISDDKDQCTSYSCLLVLKHLLQCHELRSVWYMLGHLSYESKNTTEETSLDTPDGLFLDTKCMLVDVLHALWNDCICPRMDGTISTSEKESSCLSQITKSIEFIGFNWE